jgi:hypothetical protein
MTEFKLYVTTNPPDNMPLAVLTEENVIIGVTSDVYTDGVRTYLNPLFDWAIQLIADVKGVDFRNYSINMGR